MMSLLSIILYGATNVLMVLSCLRSKGSFYKFPFWAGMISLGWFFPQAIGGYYNASKYPDFSYEDAMLFASICSAAIWVGFELTAKRNVIGRSWLDVRYDSQRLFYAAVLLCLFGFYFWWKLWSLPEEALEETQWSGTTVKYLFFSNVFKIGFLCLWLLYLSQARLLVPRFLIFLIPCLLMLLEAAILRGRRAGMMDLVGYIAVGLWFGRRIAIPRWFIIAGLTCGLVLVNGIHTYRTIMKNKDISLSERLSDAVDADYLATTKKRVEASGYEFDNYVFYRQVYVDTGNYDFGSMHWDRFIFNYVPAQLFGREFKENLMIKPDDAKASQLAKDLYGYSRATGTTNTGYSDAFGSFGWLGFIKFMLIGAIMGVLYRHAMQGAFLGQLLYIYSLTTAMQSISHGTNDILVRVWIYFFILGFPVLYLAKIKGCYEIKCN